MMREFKNWENYAHELTVTAEKIRQGGHRSIQGLQEHIAELHLSPELLRWFGVPRFDIDLTKMVDGSLEYVIGIAYDRLELGWWGFDQTPALGSAFNHAWVKSGRDWSEDWCKGKVVQTLRYIERLKLGEIDWLHVSSVFPLAGMFDLDIDRDSYDPALDQEAPVIITIPVETLRPKSSSAKILRPKNFFERKAQESDALKRDLLNSTRIFQI